MRPALEFSAKHNIKAHLTFYKLEQLPEMIEIMVSFLILDSPARKKILTECCSMLERPEVVLALVSCSNISE
jgi:hypothetical protein